MTDRSPLVKILFGTLLFIRVPLVDPFCLWEPWLPAVKQTVCVKEHMIWKRTARKEREMEGDTENKSDMI